MANCCKDCDRLQVQEEGSAPTRPEFQQPTMYDHFHNFQKFKQNKNEELQLKQRKEELLKMNANFTDWHPSSSKDLFEQYNNQETVQLRNQIRLLHNAAHGSLNSDQGTQPTNGTGTGTGTISVATNPNPSTDAGKSLKKKVSLLTISRTPVQCPIGACERTIGVTSVLSHYLRDHSEDFGVQCQEIFGGKRSVLIFDVTSLEFRENVCLGVLAYGGTKDKGSSAPAERGICMHNAFLPKPHEHFDAHLPILIMACKTTWSAMLGDKQLEAKITNAENESQHLLVIWLVSVQTTKPMHCTLTVYDKTMTSSRSIITQVRHLNLPQNPSEFLHKDTNCLRLSHGEVNILSRGGSECIHMEVMINEYDQ